MHIIGYMRVLIDIILIALFLLKFNHSITLISPSGYEIIEIG